MVRRNWCLQLPFYKVLVFFTLSGGPLVAADCSLPDSRFSLSPGNTITITSVGFTNSELDTAIGYWKKCSGYSTDFPAFQVGGAGGIPVTVQKVPGNSTALGGGCGRFTPEIVNGHLESAVITIWTHQKDGASCAPLSDVIAHEFGHALGLANAPNDSSCNGHIMGVRILSTREVYPDDCAQADDMWETSSEASPNPDPYCDAYCWTSCVNNVCPARPPDGEPCPILVDLENDGIHLTGLDDPVWFDIDADGDKDLLSWTDRGEGLLALDRNGNGRIDNGSELFGNHTRLTDGTRALNGYLALAELDDWLLGGNGNGQIDSADAVFELLWMWTDRNHDGASQPDELATLEEARILRIALDYKRSNRTDRYGNELRFLGRAWKAGRNGTERPILTWDVFFLSVP